MSFIHIFQTCDLITIQNRQKYRKWKPDMEVQYVKNHSLRHWAHSALLLPCYRWCVVASHDLAVYRFGPVRLRASGPSSRAEPLERLAVVWHAPCFPPAQQQQQPAGPTSRPNVPTHRLECQPSVLYWELGLAVLVTGLRWTADGAFCPAAPWGQVERVRKTGVFMFHLLPPLLPTSLPKRPGQMPRTLILGGKAEMENQTKEKNGMEGEKGKCDVMVWKLIS